ncbi:membrane protein insertion efficiency factor YidD [Candidatus Daviesbacteria bacterium]|nr:membrane protein insertion efficiency factor YidD [Candidatus Daviesbacteria bacterium]
MKKLLINIIKFYQLYLSFDKGILVIFAPGGACRNKISCSEYTKQAILKYGVVKGIKLGIKRIWSCR